LSPSALGSNSGNSGNAGVVPAGYTQATDSRN
jgi:hypothetical protein